MDLGRMLAQTAERFPNKTAIIFKDQKTSYAEFDRRANQVANALISLGVQPGDRVTLNGKRTTQKGADKTFGWETKMETKDFGACQTTATR